MYIVSVSRALCDMDEWAGRGSYPRRYAPLGSVCEGTRGTRIGFAIGGETTQFEM